MLPTAALSLDSAHRYNERRFGIKWERPGPKLREYIVAIRAIWDCFQNGTELDFEGEFFKFNLMTPMFNPGPIPFAPPPIYVGAVNPWNCKMAGEVADGFHCHGFHTARTLKANVIDNIQQGLDNVGRKRSDFKITAPVMAVIGSNSKEIERLLEKSRKGQWDKMASEITDEMMAEFAVEGLYEDIPSLLQKKYGDMLDEVLIYFGEPEKGDPATWQRLIRAFGQSEN